MDFIELWRQWIARNWERLSNTAKVAVLLILIAVMIFGLRSCYPPADIPSRLPPDVASVPPGSEFTGNPEETSNCTILPLENVICTGQKQHTYNLRNDVCTIGDEYNNYGRISYQIVSIDTPSGVMQYRNYCDGDDVVIPGCEQGQIAFHRIQGGGSDACKDGGKYSCREGVRVKIVDGSVLTDVTVGDGSACLIPE